MTFRFCKISFLLFVIVCGSQAEFDLEKFLSTEHDKFCLGLGLGMTVTDKMEYQREFGELLPWPQLSIEACIGDFPFAYTLKYAFSWDRGWQASDVGGIYSNAAAATWKAWEIHGGVKFYDAYKTRFHHYWCIGGLGRQEELVYAGGASNDYIERAPSLGLGPFMGTGLEFAFIEHMVAELSFKFSRARTYMYRGGLKNHYTIDLLVFIGD